jgi:hypothetical protein
VSEGKAIFYQKHMAHHLLGEIERTWLARLSHCFLIRDPAEMLASLAQHLDEPTLADTGLPQQCEIFERECDRRGNVPPVIDARDVLSDPRGLLERLCAALGVAFREEMLRWPAGPRATDGVWAKHWYHEVLQSTSFRPYQARSVALPARLYALHAECLVYYERLHAHALGGQRQAV